MCSVAVGTRIGFNGTIFSRIASRKVKFTIVFSGFSFPFYLWHSKIGICRSRSVVQYWSFFRLSSTNKIICHAVSNCTFFLRKTESGLYLWYEKPKRTIGQQKNATFSFVIINSKLRLCSFCFAFFINFIKLYAVLTLSVCEIYASVNSSLIDWQLDNHLQPISFK